MSKRTPDLTTINVSLDEWRHLECEDPAGCLCLCGPCCHERWIRGYPELHDGFMWPSHIPLQLAPMPREELAKKEWN